MSTLIVLAALGAAALAQEPERHFEAFTAYELAHMENAGPSSCAYLIGPQITPEDTVSATTCAQAIGDYFGNVRGNFAIDFDSQECAARLILARSEEAVTVKEILDAEFDKSCGGKGTS